MATSISHAILDKAIAGVSPPAPNCSNRAFEESGTQISLRAIRKSFGSREVLNGIDLSIAAGEFVAVVGRSGCGKSTLLRLLAGLDTPTSGEILRDGNLDNRPSADTRIMFQDARLLPWKRVGENVTLGQPNSRRTSEVARAALSQVELPDRAGEWPMLLSGGQRQRVALARALAVTPRLLLLDEPLGALDALTRRSMQDLIARLWAERGFTAVLVTHDTEEAVALADCVFVVEEGSIKLNLRIDLPRPRPRGTSAFAELSETLLATVMGSKQDAPSDSYTRPFVAQG